MSQRRENFFTVRQIDPCTREYTLKARPYLFWVELDDLSHELYQHPAVADADYDEETRRLTVRLHDRNDWQAAGNSVDTKISERLNGLQQLQAAA